MTRNSIHGVDKRYSSHTYEYILQISQQINEIKIKALRNDTGGLFDNLTIINLSIYGLLNEKFELAETSINLNN